MRRRDGLELPEFARNQGRAWRPPATGWSDPTRGGLAFSHHEHLGHGAHGT